ncbi:MAG: type VI secretion system baseplate subunit TssK [Rhodospirillaceae bacterium]
MNRTSPLPDPIQWYEGMLLAPQHFQQSWLRSDALLPYHIRRLMPFFQGVQRIEIDSALLVVGIFRVLALEAVMPDGLVVRHPTEGGEDLQIELMPHAEQLRQQALTVHLVVPAYKPGAAAGGEMARYRSVEAAPVVDENTGDNEQPMARLRPRLALLVGDEVPQKFVALPVARIIYSNEAFRLTEYMPPAVATGSDSVLAGQCRSIGRRLREKAAFLAGRLRAPVGTVQAPMLAETRHTVQCLVADLPRLEALLSVGITHPLDLHVALCGIAGEVAALGSGLVPPLFDAYDHNNILGSVGPVIDFIGRMIDTVAETHMMIRFTVHDDGFRLMLQPNWLDGHGLLIGVRLAPGQGEAEVETWMQESAIASTDHVGPLRLRRLRGAQRTRVERDDRLGVMPDRGVLLYRITDDPSLVEPGRLLEILGPGPRPGVRRPAEVSLFVGSAAENAGASL